MFTKAFEHWRELDEHLRWCDQQVGQHVRSSPEARWAAKVIGIGELEASAITASVGEFKQFRAAHLFCGYMQFGGSGWSRSVQAVYQVRAVDRWGRVVVVKAMSPERFFAWCAELPQGCVVVMEACGGAHHAARRLRRLGLDARLIAGHFVAPYRMAGKSGKNDANGARGLAKGGGGLGQQECAHPVGCAHAWHRLQSESRARQTRAALRLAPAGHAITRPLYPHPLHPLDVRA